MAFFDLPDCLQAAYARRRRASAKVFSPNNYLAEARLGGRNAKGAGAPRGNRNAAGSRLLRQHIRLKRHNDQQRYHLLVLAAAIAHLEGRGRRDFSSNNYLVEYYRASGLAAPNTKTHLHQLARRAPQHDGRESNSNNRIKPGDRQPLPSC